ncbi:hypothetical protein XPA_009583 [Xanthoria parietina]
MARAMYRISRAPSADCDALACFRPAVVKTMMAELLRTESSVPYAIGLPPSAVFLPSAGKVLNRAQSSPRRAEVYPTEPRLTTCLAPSRAERAAGWTFKKIYSVSHDIWTFGAEASIISVRC